MTDPSVVEQKNADLSTLLERAKTGVPEEDIHPLVQGLNDILYTAIDQIPCDVNAVRIHCKLDVDERCEDIYARNAPKLKEYLSLLNGQSLLNDQTPKGEVEFEVVKHLPYSFTTGTHGSGERAAMGASCANIVFKRGFDVRNSVDVTLDLGVGSWLFNENITLRTREIRSIALEQVADKDYSKVLGTEPDTYARKLFATRSTVQHYLNFKGFRTLLADPDKHIPDGPWKEGMKKIYRKIGTGDFRMLDFDRDVDFFKAGLNGFAVYFSDTGPILYKFKSEPLPQRIRDAQAGHTEYAAYLIAKHLDGALPQAKTYQGIDIIKTLHELKVERRF
ncbi:hypothetical protein J4219_00360 [Candidatus Woesearchaeota archaeon]|nr:hypothetical protein [Candidatus Woesearchaeota archaeon]